MSEQEESNKKVSEIDTSIIPGNSSLDDKGAMINPEDHIGMRQSMQYTERFITGTGYYREYISPDSEQ